VYATTGSTAGSFSNFMAVSTPRARSCRQVTVCERSGELQRAEHQSEERERVGSSRHGAGRVETRRDVVDDSHQFVGEDLFGGGGTAGDLGEQCSRRGRQPSAYWSRCCGDR
jgi:hypothetical protein